MDNIFVTFALMVIRHPSDDSLFALVNEGPTKGWWLAGGGVDGHETFEQGARREALEEAGVEVQPDAKLLQIELGYHRLRYILTGRAASRELKYVPDKESMGAAWMTLKETESIHRGTHNVPNSRLRGPEPVIWFKHLLRGGAVFDIDDVVDHLVEPGTTGLKYERRDVFNAKISCVIACQVGGGKYVADTKEGSMRLPEAEPKLEWDESVEQCAARKLLQMGYRNVIVRNVVRVRDHRMRNNTLDFRVGLFATAEIGTDGAFVLSEPEAFHDDFDRQIVDRINSGKILFPLTLLGIA